MPVMPIEITRELKNAATAAGYLVQDGVYFAPGAPPDQRFVWPEETWCGPVGPPAFFIFRHEYNFKRLTHNQARFLLAHKYTTTCRYPAWGDDAPRTGRFCDKPTALGAYCTEHARMCYRFSWDRKLKPLASNYHGTNIPLNAAAKTS
jgi:hypothetical protein